MGLFSTEAEKQAEKDALASKIARRMEQLRKLTDIQLIMLFLAQMEDGCSNDGQIAYEMLDRLPAIDPNPNYE